MSPVLTVVDETASGERVETTPIKFESDVVTARELIRYRVIGEIEAYKRGKRERFEGFIQPKDSDPIRGGWRLKRGRKIDVEEQVETALKAFSSNGFFLLAGNHQVESLDEEIDLREQQEVSFVKLVPLVGG